MRTAAGLAIVIAGGGTGGHLYPGIAVARELLRRRPEAAISFAGTARGLEARVVPQEGFALDLLRSAGLKGKSLGARLRGAALVVPGLLDAWRIVSKRRPHMVIGVGGYSSGPVVFIAALRGIPTMVLEQNVAPGLTNRILARVVSAAALTYEETMPMFVGKGRVTGNPVRAEFFASAPRAADAAPQVLVLGGSQGAHALNLAVAAAVPELLRRCPDLRMLHQTGVRDVYHVRQEYEKTGATVRAEAFLDRVVDHVVAADLVICRAGATTLAELAAAGRPAVLVPFPMATDDHQRRNARLLEAAGAAVMLEERDASAPRLADTVLNLLADPHRLVQMSAAMKRFARPRAAADIVDRVLELAT